MFRLIDRYLDPSESLLEILFGLIMALTMTAGARLLSDPATVSPVELMVALIGCNVAWGAIDAVFHLLGSQFNRNRRVRFVRRLQAAASDEQAIALIREEFALEGEPPTRAEDRAAFHRALLELLRNASAERARFSPGDFAAAAIVLALVTLTALPGLVPLLLIDHVDTALRAANALQVVLLFIIGYRWAHYTGTPGWRGALIVGLLGVALVLVAVALGG
jgi:hypothetical protein